MLQALKNVLSYMHSHSRPLLRKERGIRNSTLRRDIKTAWKGRPPAPKVDRSMGIGAIGGRTGLSVFDLVQTEEQLRYRNRKETGWLLFQVAPR